MVYWRILGQAPGFLTRKRCLGGAVRPRYDPLMNAEELKQKIVEAAKDFEWKPPVEEDTFLDYEFHAWPEGCFPRYPIRNILTDSAIDADGEQNERRH